MLATDFQQRRHDQFRRIELRADLAVETRDDHILAPLRPVTQRGHRRARFLAFADAFERLVVLILQQGIEAAGLVRVIQQIATENADEARLRHERRQREEHEVAFRTHAAPTVGGTLAQQMEIAVATGEMRVVMIGAGELPRHRQLR